MTRDAEHTPSPQSVVVPVEPTEDMMLAGALVGPDTNNGQFGYDDARTVFVAMLAAAPAPSSLAGGIGREQVLAIVRQFASPSWCSVDRLVDTLLAALSPEAPALEGVDWQPIETALQDGTKIDLWGYWPEHDRWVRTPDAVWDAERCDWKVNGFYAGAYVHPPRFTHWRAITGPDALTPRHEAPDWTAATEAAWAENNSHEAPAEGAGELAASLTQKQRQALTGEAVREGGFLKLRRELGPSMRCALQRRGVVVDRMYCEILTPLGEAIREHLLNKRMGQ